jgi:hypothetical protein
MIPGFMPNKYEEDMQQYNLFQLAAYHHKPGNKYQALFWFFQYRSSAKPHFSLNLYTEELLYSVYHKIPSKSRRNPFSYGKGKTASEPASEAV